MKKLLFILNALMLILSASCKKTTVQEITMATGKVIRVNVASDNWGTVNGKSWSGGISVQEIDDKYTQSGATLLYRKTTDRDFEQWPVVYKGISYSYSVRNGQIIFDVAHSDGQTPISRPEPMVFKLVLQDTK